MASWITPATSNEELERHSEIAVLAPRGLSPSSLDLGIAAELHYDINRGATVPAPKVVVDLYEVAIGGLDWLRLRHAARFLRCCPDDPSRESSLEGPVLAGRSA